MRIAIVHDWLIAYAGAERVLEQILNIYPEADLYSLLDFIPAEARGFICNKQVHTSFIQKLPFAKSKYRYYLPLMPLAIEQFDLSHYDLVISTSHAVAKGVMTGPDQLHISYIHSPLRYAWDLQYQYLHATGLDRGIQGWLAKYILHRIRSWDINSSYRADIMVANSHFISRRIKKIYRRDSQVIYPPVAVQKFQYCDKKADYYLTASRLVPYKNVDMIVNAFTQMPNKKLKVVGDGPDYKKIKKTAHNHPNIEMLGYQPTARLREIMQQAQAFIFAAEEDFGITVVEAQACGTPVIAYAKGGALETTRGLDDATPTGVFFHQQSIDALKEVIALFEKSRHLIDKKQCVENAKFFNEERFRLAFKSFVDKQYAKWLNGRQTPSYKYAD